ncbi:hypothetical protein YPPY36_0818, partial [Yersinia pestis PY-36]
MLWPFIRC